MKIADKPLTLENMSLPDNFIFQPLFGDGSLDFAFELLKLFDYQGFSPNTTKTELYKQWKKVTLKNKDVMFEEFLGTVDILCRIFLLKGSNINVILSKSSPAGKELVSRLVYLFNIKTRVGENGTAQTLTFHRIAFAFPSRSIYWVFKGSCNIINPIPGVAVEYHTPIWAQMCSNKHMLAFAIIMSHSIDVVFNKKSKQSEQNRLAKTTAFMVSLCNSENVEVMERLQHTVQYGIMHFNEKIRKEDNIKVQKYQEECLKADGNIRFVNDTSVETKDGLSIEKIIHIVRPTISNISKTKMLLNDNLIEVESKENLAQEKRTYLRAEFKEYTEEDIEKKLQEDVLSGLQDWNSLNFYLTDYFVKSLEHACAWMSKRKVSIGHLAINEYKPVKNNVDIKGIFS